MSHVLHVKGLKFKSSKATAWWQPRSGTWLVRDYGGPYASKGAPAERAFSGLVSKLETALRRVGYCHRMASPGLIRLIMGHPVDVLFQSGSAATTAILRTVRRTQCIFSDWMVTGGPAHGTENG